MVSVMAEGTFLILRWYDTLECSKTVWLIIKTLYNGKLTKLNLRLARGGSSDPLVTRICWLLLYITSWACFKINISFTLILVVVKTQKRKEPCDEFLTKKFWFCHWLCILDKSKVDTKIGGLSVGNFKRLNLFGGLIKKDKKNIVFSISLS